MAIKTLLIEYDDAHGDGMGGYPLRAPAVDVVRCRDCMHFKKADSGSFCAKSITALTDPDGFCAWGARRDG